MDLRSESCSSVCLASQLAVLHDKKLWYWTLHANVWTNFFHTCYAYRQLWLLPFDTTFFDLDLAWKSQGQHKAKPLGFISSVFDQNGIFQAWYIVEIHHSGREPLIILHAFQQIRMKYMLLKQFKLDILILLLSEVLWNKGNMCSFTDYIKKLQTGLYLDVYELLWFKLGLMIDH